MIVSIGSNSFEIPHHMSYGMVDGTQVDGIFISPIS